MTAPAWRRCRRQVDSGASVPVTFDPAGNFSFTTGLPLTGQADGNHTVHLQATDRAGNVSGVADVAFTLTTTTPGLVAPPLDPTVATTLAAATAVPLHGQQSDPEGRGPGHHRPDAGGGAARPGARPRRPADPGRDDHRPEPSRVRHHDDPRRRHVRPGRQRRRAADGQLRQGRLPAGAAARWTCPGRTTPGCPTWC